eukprot:Skav219090  [mRNA]  locus=scaffold1574:97234:106425:+ [translate_table: standard]
MSEVAKHNSKTDCWVVVDGQVLDVTSFLGEHPGGELAILTFAGKDATEEIHPPDVIGKYAPESVIGNVGSGVAAPVAGGAAPKAGGMSAANTVVENGGRVVLLVGSSEMACRAFRLSLPVAEKTNLARIVTKANVFELVTEGNVCVGCVYQKGGQNFKEFGPVILASGGFGADFTSNSLLAKYRPDLLHLPTTNGEHCTGDGIKMGEAIGAKTIDLEWVQVHPTGLVKPDDADAKIKFLAAEAALSQQGVLR